MEIKKNGTLVFKNSSLTNDVYKHQYANGNLTDYNGTYWTKTVNSQYSNFKMKTAKPGGNTYYPLHAPAFSFVAGQKYMYRCFIRCNKCTAGMSMNFRAARCNNDWVTTITTICSPALADGKWHEYYIIKEVPASFDRSGTIVTSAPMFEIYTGNLYSSTVDTIEVDFDIKNIEIIPLSTYSSYQGYYEEPDREKAEIKKDQVIINNLIEL